MQLMYSLFASTAYWYNSITALTIPLSSYNNMLLYSLPEPSYNNNMTRARAA